MKYLGFKLHPSFEFKDSMPSNEYIKVNSLLFNPAYEINKNITGNKKSVHQSLDLGFKTKIELPHKIMFDAVLSKFVTIHFAQDETLTTYLMGIQ